MLGRRLREITEQANQLAPKSARGIFRDDDVKFDSRVTLFALAAPEDLAFRAALDLFFDGVRDERTAAILTAQATAHGAGQR